MSDYVLFGAHLTEEEQDFADHMMAATGLTSPSDLVRLGLYHLAKHLDVPIGNQVFAIGGRTSTRTRRHRVSA